MRRTITLSRESLTEAEIPKAFWELGASTYFGAPEALTKVERYINNAEQAIKQNIGIRFHGAAGSLRTFLLTYALKCLLARGFSVQYMTTERLTEYYQDRSADVSFVELVTQSDFFGLDNLGLPLNAAQVTAFKVLQSYRKDSFKPLLVVTHLDDTQLQSVYPEIAPSLVDHTSLVECTVNPFKKGKILEEMKSKIC